MNREGGYVSVVWPSVESLFSLLGGCLVLQTEELFTFLTWLVKLTREKQPSIFPVAITPIK